MSDNQKGSPIKKGKNRTKILISTVLFMVFMGCIVGVGINVIDWHFRGYSVVKNKVDREYETQINQLANRNEKIAAYYAASTTLLDDLIYSESKKLSNFFRFEFSQTAIKEIKIKKQSLSKIAEVESDGMNTWSEFCSITYWTGCVILAKFVSVACSFWLYVFYSLLGILDGLVSRYIRTAEGGRESTFIFHKVSDTIIKIPFYIVMIYLIIPISFNPELAVIALGLLFFGFFYTSTSQLKKYL